MTTYETVEGTEPQELLEHQPRTVKRLDAENDLYMMTEIGDGVFVQWGTCRRCNTRVSVCKCVGGPIEPDFMKRWRDERFAKELKARPAPEVFDPKILNTVISALRDRGFTVEKAKKNPPETTAKAEEILAESPNLTDPIVDKIVEKLYGDDSEPDAPTGPEYIDLDPGF